MDLNLSKSLMDLIFWGRFTKCLGFHTYFREKIFFDNIEKQACTHVKIIYVT